MGEVVGEETFRGEGEGEGCVPGEFGDGYGDLAVEVFCGDEFEATISGGVIERRGLRDVDGRLLFEGGCRMGRDVR